MSTGGPSTSDVPSPSQSLRNTAILIATVLIGLLAFPSVDVASAPPPSAPPKLTLQQIFQANAAAVVVITAVDAQGKTLALGSGFVVTPSGVIVTNHHVIEARPGVHHLVVKLPRGDSFQDVRIIYDEERRDFAVLSIRAVGVATVRLGDSDKVRIGDEVVAIGNPLGLELTLSAGVVGAVRLDRENNSYFIQHQAPISPGSSGGPLLNAQGEVIGINTFTLRGGQNLNGAIPINYVKPYLQDPAKTTYEEYLRSQGSQPGTSSPPIGAPPTVPPGTAGTMAQQTVMLSRGEITYTLSADRATYGLVDPIDITFTIRNGGNQDAKFDFATTQYYDFVIERDNFGVIARWSQGQTFAPNPPPLLLGPGKSIVFNTRWLQKDQNSQIVPAGIYRIIAIFPLKDDPVSIALEFHKLL